MGGNSDGKYSLKLEHKRKHEEQLSLKLDKKNRRSRSSSASSSANRERRTKSKHSKKRSESYSSSCVSSSDVEDRKLRKKHKKNRSTSRRDKEERLKRKKEKKKAKKLVLKGKRTESTDDDCNDVPLKLMEKSKFMAPMTKEEWEKKQSVIRRVYDEESGRYRLIKGDGEIIEEIVSRDRHKEINQQATLGDGNYFQSKISSSLITK